MKNQKGITLIALVITIIVLLILAGVSIALLTGENGILNRAASTQAVEQVAAGKDQIALAQADGLAAYYEGQYKSPASEEDKQTAVANKIKSVASTSEYDVTTTDGKTGTIESKKDSGIKSAWSVDANGVLSWTDTFSK